MGLTAEAPDDQDVWLDAMGGSADAWGELFLRHHRVVYNYCFRRTAQWSVAEDLTSAVFLEAWRRRGEVQLYGESAIPWLLGIATMLTRNHERTLRRYQAALARVAPPGRDGGGSDAGDPADVVAARVDAERCAAVVLDALGRLPRRDREIVSLVASGQLSHGEIADVLGVPVGTVKSRLSRARKKLGLIGLAGEPFDGGEI